MSIRTGRSVMENGVSAIHLTSVVSRKHGKNGAKIFTLFYTRIGVSATGILVVYKF